MSNSKFLVSVLSLISLMQQAPLAMAGNCPGGNCPVRSGGNGMSRDQLNQKYGYWLDDTQGPNRAFGYVLNGSFYPFDRERNEFINEAPPGMRQWKGEDNSMRSDGTRYTARGLDQFGIPTDNPNCGNAPDVRGRVSKAAPTAPAARLGAQAGSDEIPVQTPPASREPAQQFKPWREIVREITGKEPTGTTIEIENGAQFKALREAFAANHIAHAEQFSLHGCGPCAGRESVYADHKMPALIVHVGTVGVGLNSLASDPVIAPRLQGGGYPQPHHFDHNGNEVAENTDQSTAIKALVKAEYQFKAAQAKVVASAPQARPEAKKEVQAVRGEGEVALEAPPAHVARPSTPKRREAAGAHESPAAKGTRWVCDGKTCRLVKDGADVSARLGALAAVDPSADGKKAVGAHDAPAKAEEPAKSEVPAKVEDSAKKEDVAKKDGDVPPPAGPAVPAGEAPVSLPEPAVSEVIQKHREIAARIESAIIAKDKAALDKAKQELGDFRDKNYAAVPQKDQKEWADGVGLRTRADAALKELAAADEAAKKETAEKAKTAALAAGVAAGDDKHDDKDFDAKVRLVAAKRAKEGREHLDSKVEELKNLFDELTSRENYLMKLENEMGVAKTEWEKAKKGVKLYQEFADLSAARHLKFEHADELAYRKARLAETSETLKNLKAEYHNAKDKYDSELERSTKLHAEVISLTSDVRFADELSGSPNRRVAEEAVKDLRDAAKAVRDEAARAAGSASDSRRRSTKFGPVAVDMTDVGL